MGYSLRMCLFKGMEIQKIAISSFCSSGRLEDSHIAWIASQNLVASSAMLSAFRLRSAANVPSIHLPINDLNQSIKQNTKHMTKKLTQGIRCIFGIQFGLEYMSLSSTFHFTFYTVVFQFAFAIFCIFVAGLRDDLCDFLCFLQGLPHLL